MDAARACACDVASADDMEQPRGPRRGARRPARSSRLERGHPVRASARSTRPPDDWDRVLGINLKSVYLGARPVIPHMRATRRGVDRQHRLGQRLLGRARACGLLRGQGRRNQPDSGDRARRTAATGSAATASAPATSTRAWRSATSTPGRPGGRARGGRQVARARARRQARGIAAWRCSSARTRRASARRSLRGRRRPLGRRRRRPRPLDGLSALLRPPAAGRPWSAATWGLATWGPGHLASGPARPGPDRKRPRVTSPCDGPAMRFLGGRSVSAHLFCGTRCSV